MECLADSGCDLVTIPHNSNLSGGVSLKIWEPTSAAGMALQSRYQVAAEVYQAKGASECYYNPAAGYNDPDCQFEQLTAKKVKAPGATNFIRTALKMGVDTKGVNPLQLGIVGGTDNHNGSAGYVDEATYVGHAGHEDDTALLRLNSSPDYSPGAITGVWAPQNTRDEIFAAIKRRETFATSGPRITVRFYQVNDQQKNLKPCTDSSFPSDILPSAVPMGGTFKADAVGASPRFALTVWPDAVPQNVPDPNVPGGKISRVAKIAAAKALAAALDAAWDGGSLPHPRVDEIVPAADLGLPAFGAQLRADPLAVGVERDLPRLGHPLVAHEQERSRAPCRGRPACGACAPPRTAGAR